MISSTNRLIIIISLICIFSGGYLTWLGLQDSEAPSTKENKVAMKSTLGIEGQKALVTEVVDGDTFKIANNKSVRIVGVDTPETVDPRRPVGCFGKEASNATKSLLNGKEVILQKDVSDTDKFGRLLRLVYLPLDDGEVLFVNDYLVRGGFAKVDTIAPDVKFSDRFQQAQDQAKQKNLGMWKACVII